MWRVWSDDQFEEETRSFDLQLREGRSQREIAKLTGVDRKAISKYIKEYEAKRKELEQSGDPSETVN
jgi:predicted transcriptional regulator